MSSSQAEMYVMPQQSPAAAAVVELRATGASADLARDCRLVRGHGFRADLVGFAGGVVAVFVEDFLEGGAVGVRPSHNREVNQKEKYLPEKSKINYAKIAPNSWRQILLKFSRRLKNKDPKKSGFGELNERKK